MDPIRCLTKDTGCATNLWRRLPAMPARGRDVAGQPSWRSIAAPASACGLRGAAQARSASR